MLKDKIDYGIAIKALNNATKLYDEGHPTMGDEEWDNLYYEVKRFEEVTGIIFTDSPTHHIDYKVVNSLAKVKHTHPMLSLDKTKDLNEVIRFVEDKDFIIMAKMDGLTCSLRHINGRLMSAETRGDGEIGEDVLHNIVKTHGVPYAINSPGETIIDGEVICTYKDFNKFSDEYKNPRNFASGSVRLLDSKESYKRSLTFVAWDCISPIAKTLNEKLAKLEQFGFIVVPHIDKTMMEELNLSIPEAIELIKKKSEELSYPIDGVVIKYNDCEYYDSLGYTDHHFRGGLAYKFYDETFSTKLKGITYEVSRTGAMTPVAVFNPVIIDGTEVTKASLHNISILKETLGEKFWAGQELEVFKANMIIPQIYSANKIDDERTKMYLQIPEVCPICGAPTVIKKDGVAEILYCSNANCPSKVIDKFSHFCSKACMNIEGMSDSTIEKLLDWKYIENFGDIYTLSSYKDEWMAKDGFSKVSVEKLLKAIEKSRNTTFVKFISSIGITGIGKKQAELIFSIAKTYNKFREMVDDSFDWSIIKGFGKIVSNNINSFNYSEADHCAMKLIFEEIEDKKSAGTLNGLKFVITGKLNSFKNRTELIEKIKELGGYVQDAVNKETNYLINNDSTSASSKNKKAQELGIKIITENEFFELI